MLEPFISVAEAFSQADDCSLKKIPFFIAVDFELSKALFYPLHSIPHWLHFSFNSISANDFQHRTSATELQPEDFPFDEYQNGYSVIRDHLKRGNSYLANYSSVTPLKTDLSLSQIYAVAQAPYRLLVDDRFTVFSPESFVQIKNGTISTFPMKGTIDASIPNAEEIILNDTKEKAEHATITDLLRNDVSRVAHSVQVKNYRYIKKIVANNRSLLQVSSHIQGVVSDRYSGKIGSILSELLPAGSVSGAPKDKTVEIIRQAEGKERGFYCGIAGVYDGESFDSCVLIRFIEKYGSRLYYKSGGGVTYLSEVEKEYDEMKAKIYVPIA